MSAQVDFAAEVLRPMTVDVLDGVMALEAEVYPFPWTRGNFVDSLVSGYTAWTLDRASGELVGYCVAMAGAGEMHLLNITVAPAHQGRGHARVMIDALIALCRDERALELWLEVRGSNVRAKAMYEHFGFEQVGVRKGYYPAPFGRREDAVVMSLKLQAAEARNGVE